MKKNNILYILLLVLVIMNGFFLFNYLGRPDHKGPKESGNFIVKQLKFNETQLQQFNTLETKHHNQMRAIGDDVKELKNELFNKITSPEINQDNINGLITSITTQVAKKEKELFNRLRAIYELCDDKQKAHFSDIIKKARRFDRQGPDKPRKPE